MPDWSPNAEAKRERMTWILVFWVGAVGAIASLAGDLQLTGHRRMAYAL